MTEEKESLSKTEYDKVGEMLLELIAECPHVPQAVRNVPQGAGILFDRTGAELGLFILTDGGRKKNNVIGGYSATIRMEIAYQSKADTNSKRFNAQDTTNKIAEWISDLNNFPKMTNGIVINKFEASGSQATIYSTTKDGYIAYAANVVMEYEVD